MHDNPCSVKPEEIEPDRVRGFAPPLALSTSEPADGLSLRVFPRPDAGVGGILTALRGLSSEILDPPKQGRSTCGKARRSSPQVGRIAVEMLKKEKFAKCALSFFDLLA
jgi:hypothetical protein